MLEIATAYGLAMTNLIHCCVKPISIKDNYLIRDSKILSSKGLFCFDVSSAKDIDYSEHAGSHSPAWSDRRAGRRYSAARFLREKDGSRDFDIASGYADPYS